MKYAILSGSLYIAHAILRASDVATAPIPLILASSLLVFAIVKE